MRLLNSVDAEPKLDAQTKPDVDCRRPPHRYREPQSKSAASRSCANWVVDIFGIVFLAFDPVLGREVAIEGSSSGGDRHSAIPPTVLEGGHAAAVLNHPNLVSIFESGEWGPVCYIAEEYCAGQTLATWLQERVEPVPPAIAARLIATLAEAMDYAHGQGIVHRDLSPVTSFSMQIAHWNRAPRRAKTASWSSFPS